VRFIVTSGSQSSAASTATLTGVPVITGVSPGTVNGGVPAQVTINGRGFLTGATVSYGPTGVGSTATVNSVSATQITATVTVAVGTTVTFRVTSGGQTSQTSPVAVTGVAPPTPAPTISNISPTTGSASGGQTVVITGSNFTDVSAVSFGGIAATSFNALNSTTSVITAVSPAGTANTQGVITVTAAGGPASSSQQFTWCGTPSVASVSPTSVPAGATVTVVGSNFCPNAVVQLRSISLSSSYNQSTTFVDQFKLTFIAAFNQSVSTTLGFRGTRGSHVMAAISGLEVYVLGSGGTSPLSPSAVISVTPAPVVTSVAPATGPIAGGTSVTITGSDLTGASAVRFGSVAATTFTVVSDTSIIATSPANAAGVVDVVVVTASGTSAVSAADQFVYSTSVPTMGEWFAVLLALLLGGAGYLNLRQRQNTGRA
jgi:hypothetical protein